MKFDTIIWCSDLNSNTGEGVLAKKFLQKYLLYRKDKKIKIVTYEKNFFFKNKIIQKNIKFSNNFFHKYFGPLFGAFYLLFNYKKKELVYVNYLPLWNFLLFLLIPKKTILGPITGGAYSKNIKSLSFFLRKYIFPLLYKLSLIIIHKKFKKIIFSTRLLENFYKNLKNTDHNVLYDFIFIFFKKNNYKRSRKYDLIYYNRNHPTKQTDKSKHLIAALSKKFVVCVVGDYYQNENVLNFGKVSRKQVYNLLLQSKVAMSGAENLFSLFTIDAINCRTKVIYNAKIKIKYKTISNYLIAVDYNNFSSAYSKILKLLNSNLKIDDHKFDLSVNKKKKVVNNFLLDYFSDK
jgi:hypothetical protein